MNHVKLPEYALTSGQAASAAVVTDKVLSGAEVITLGHTGAGAGAAFIEVSHDYNPNLAEAAQTPTWLALKDAAGADIVFPTIGTSRTYDRVILGAAFRVRGGTSAAPANFSGNGVMQGTYLYEGC